LIDTTSRATTNTSSMDQRANTPSQCRWRRWRALPAASRFHSANSHRILRMGNTTLNSPRMTTRPHSRSTISCCSADHRLTVFSKK